MTKNSKQKAFIILGMHRSGTSAFSGVLSKMNVFMGSDLFSAQKGVNEKGFFENSKIVELNEHIFDIVSSSWDDPLGIQVSFDRVEALEAVRKRSLNFIKKEYSDKLLWGIKDPRMSVLLPFWQPIFSQLNLDVNYVIMVRHPIEVCHSLQKRDQFSQTKSLILWLNYTLSSLQYCKGLNYQILLYDDLMTDPEKSISRIIATIDSDVLSSVKEASSFISQKLRNHQSNFDADSKNTNKVFEFSKKLYNELNQPTLNQVAIEQIRNDYMDYNNSLNGVLSEHLRGIKSSEVVYRRLFNEAYYSLWWKISWPLRVVEKKITSLVSSRG